MPPVISAANLAAAKNGTNLPGSFNATHPATASAPTSTPAPAPAARPAVTTAVAAPGGSTTSAQDVAAAQAAQAQAAAEANYQNIKSGDMSTINSNIGANASQYNSDILGAFQDTGGYNSQQSNINQEQTQNELARLQGMQGVRDMVNNGVQGGGVMLDNAGAGTSSAGEALARAYGILGRQQASGVGQQAAEGESSISNDQNNLTNAENFFTGTKMPNEKQSIVNNIVSAASQSLTYLNAMALSSSLPDQIDIANQIAQVKAQATAALSAYDGELASNVASNAPQTSDQTSSKAASLFAAGTAPEQEFNFTSEAPAQFANTGPSASSLPIFTSSQANKNDNGLVQ